MLSLQVEATPELGSWFLLTVSWDRNNGLDMYINKEKRSHDNGRISPSQAVTGESTNLVIGRNINSMTGTYYSRVAIKSVAVFNFGISSEQQPRFYDYFIQTSKWTIHAAFAPQSRVLRQGALP